MAWHRIIPAIAQGAHDWENRLENGIWTYTLEDIWSGLQDAYAKLAADVKSQCGASLKKIGAIGFSAMMHGYMVFDKEGTLMVPFRTCNGYSRLRDPFSTKMYAFNCSGKGHFLFSIRCD